METQLTAKELTELKNEYCKVASKICDFGICVNNDKDTATKLFNTNATELYETFQNACILLYKTANLLNRKLEETIITL